MPHYFLHYMLQKVCNVAFTPRTSVGEDSFYDFIYFLFPAYLRKAINQGVYRAYVTREYNDANVRGPIDVARHIRKNVPFNGKIAYHTREYTTDNCVTQLIRHTIEHIRSLSMGDAVLNGSDGKNRDDVSEIVAATPTYSRHNRMSVIAKNLRPVTHPYYTAYEPLRKLCLAILRHQKLSYGENNSDSINGILFDGAALWEEYLNVIMRDSEIGEKLVHPNNRTGFRRQHLFELDDGTKNRCIYPDFLFGADSKQGKILTAEAVLDAKYRRLDDGLDRDASFQILSYLLRFSSKKGYLLYPSGEPSVKDKSYTLIQPKDSSAIVIKAIPFHVPEYDETISFQKFSEKMQKEEGDFCKEIKKSC
nr:MULTISPECIES: McrC family protein [unclassified Fibrobacter]